MASTFITSRKTKGGRRFVVRYRLGGRAYPIQHAGSFGTLKEARIRRDLIAGELAASRNPRRLLAELTAGPPPTTALTTCRDRFLASRIDIDANTIRNNRTALKKACERFGDRDPASLTVAEIAEWVADLAGGYKPGTVQLYLIALRLLLDHAGIDPNPARDPRVKLPRREREEPQPPSGSSCSRSSTP